MDINQWTGAASDNDVQKRFKRFDDETSNPVTFIGARMLDVLVMEPEKSAYLDDEIINAVLESSQVGSVRNCG